ncbi:MAG: CPBP family intramembrane glutamic endopeptidase [Steroidobacteraceae bacterium]
MSQKPGPDARRPGRIRPVVVIGLLIALVLPFCHLGDLGKAHSGLGPLWGGEALWWVLFAGLLLYVLLVERKPLSSIGLRVPGVMDTAFALVAAIAAVLGIGLIVAVVLPAMHLSMPQRINSLFLAPFLFRVGLVTRAAFVEEVAFRGYGFERISELTASPLLAALVTFALFALAHLSGGGWAQVMIAAWGALVLTLLS